MHGPCKDNIRCTNKTFTSLHHNMYQHVSQNSTSKLLLTKNTAWPGGDCAMAIRMSWEFKGPLPYLPLEDGGTLPLYHGTIAISSWEAIFDAASSIIDRCMKRGNNPGNGNGNGNDLPPLPGWAAVGGGEANNGIVVGFWQRSTFMDLRFGAREDDPFSRPVSPLPPASPPSSPLSSATAAAATDFTLYGTNSSDLSSSSRMGNETEPARPNVQQIEGLTTSWKWR